MVIGVESMVGGVYHVHAFMAETTGFMVAVDGRTEGLGESFRASR